MAIVKKPALAAAPAPTPKLEQFIQGAPDGGGQKPAPSDEEGVQISLRMSREQLERITAIAKRQGIPRASYIKRAVFLQVEADERK